MNRVRSPKYPNFSLRQAVRQVEKVFKADRRNAIDRADAVKHMGYTSLSGPADKTLATLVQYGLLERVGKGQVRASDAAVQILHPDSPKQRAEALAKAAAAPEVFKAIRTRFPEGVSSESLRSFLVRENFMDRAIEPIMKAYADSEAYLKQEGASFSGGDTVGDGAESTLPDDDEEESTVYSDARVGDLVQWESQGELRLEKPTRVRLVTPDGQWIAVEGSEAGIPMSEVIVHERAVPLAPPVPRFEIEREAQIEKPIDGETEWIRSDLGSDTKVRLIVKGEMGPKQIGKLIRLLQAQKAVLSDDDDGADLV